MKPLVIEINMMVKVLGLWRKIPLHAHQSPMSGGCPSGGETTLDLEGWLEETLLPLLAGSRGGTAESQEDRRGALSRGFNQPSDFPSPLRERAPQLLERFPHDPRVLTGSGKSVKAFLLEARRPSAGWCQAAGWVFNAVGDATCVSSRIPGGSGVGLGGPGVVTWRNP